MISLERASGESVEKARIGAGDCRTVSQLKRIQRRRLRRVYRVRNKLRRVSNRPRLSVFRSNKHIYAQVVDDIQGRTLAAASTTEKVVQDAGGGYGGNAKAAVVVGRLIAERALAAGITKVVFDRGLYKYHGRVAALADAARDAGLDIGAKPVPEEKPSQKEPPKKDKAKGKTKADKGGGKKT